MADVEHHELTILLAGGGTGGHLYPGIAVAEALRQVLPGAKLVFLCTTKEIDRVILGPGGYAAGVAVKVGALKGVPAAIINPDVIPGRANQYLMQYVKAVCCQFG